MNRNPSGLLFSQCIDGFVKYKTAEGLSPERSILTSGY